MNLFCTDECPVKSAIALPNILVNKMAQEAVQLMSVAHFELDVHKNYRYYLNQKYAEWVSRTEKRPIVATWTKRNKPDWIDR